MRESTDRCMLTTNINIPKLLIDGREREHQGIRWQGKQNKQTFVELKSN